MSYKITTREITTDYGTEIIVEKKHNLNKDKWKDRLWVIQPGIYKKLVNEGRL